MQDVAEQLADPEWVQDGVQVEVQDLHLVSDMEDPAQDTPGEPPDPAEDVAEELPDPVQDMPEQSPDLEWVPAGVPDHVLDMWHLVLDGVV